MEILSREGLVRRLDEMVVEGVARAIPTLTSPTPLSINLSARSLLESDFIAWLASRIERMRLPRGRMVFEMSEHGIVQNEGAVDRLAAALRRAGAEFAIDHFGVHRNSIALLPRFKPAYVKLAGLHTPNVCSDAGSRFLVEAIVRAARQLDAPVIAQNVENETQLAALCLLGVAGYQGFVNGAPAPWPLPEAGADIPRSGT
jgi:EAL domain-containing protein (putative c-di-GMP-specific phosphodiesterase class I)